MHEFAIPLVQPNLFSVVKLIEICCPSCPALPIKSTGIKMNGWSTEIADFLEQF